MVFIVRDDSEGHPIGLLADYWEEGKCFILNSTSSMINEPKSLKSAFAGSFKEYNNFK